MKRTGFKQKPRKPMARVSSNPANVKLRATKKKAVTITKLKAQLWQLCRELTFKEYGTSCYTCPARELQGSNLHCGHFITSSICSMFMRYALENLRPQCYACNIHRSGNWLAYETHLLADGIDVEALKRRNQETKGLLYGRFWVEGKIREYEHLLISQTPE